MSKGILVWCLVAAVIPGYLTYKALTRPEPKLETGETINVIDPDRGWIEYKITGYEWRGREYFNYGDRNYSPQWWYYVVSRQGLGDWSSSPEFIPEEVIVEYLPVNNTG